MYNYKCKSFYVIRDSMTSITVRISEELKAELIAAGVKISEVTRRALEEEMKRIREERARESAERLSQILSNVPDEEIVKAVRETRDQR